MALFIVGGNAVYAQNTIPFVTTWEVAAGGLGITIPTNPNSDFAYRYTVDWGDNSADTRVYTGDATHTYTTAGIYTVSIAGTFPSIYFNAPNSKFNADERKIKTIKQWGDNPWKSMNSAFAGCPNLTMETTAGNPDLSNVTNMSSMFNGASTFNQNIGGWDVSNVTNMRGMFVAADAFNQDLNRWDVSNVTDMRQMFIAADAFNGDISGWDVSNVTDMSWMFYRAYAFNQDLNRWDVSNVTDMSWMFTHAVTFNGDISGWDVSKVTDMSEMFYHAEAFNQDLNRWDVSSVVDMSRMFESAVTFNGNISGWDVSSVVNMHMMFRHNVTFNGNISGWDVSSVTDMDDMFGYTTAFNQDLNRWDVSNVTNMRGMFYHAEAFNQDINRWDVSKVTDMSWMFDRAYAFNQDLNRWDVSKVTDMYAMFAGATAFNRDLSGWDVSKVTDMDDMFSGVTLSIANYDALLSGWSALPTLQRGFEFGGGYSKYCNESARNILVNTYNWRITDGGKDTDENCLIDQAVFAFASTSLTKSTGDAAFTITPTGGSGTGGITYLSTDPGVASIAADSGEVTIASVGTTTITATKAGDTTYNPATASYTLTIDNAIDYSNAFVTTWEVTDGSLGITIPTAHWAFDYSYTVDWGDNSADTRVYTGNAHHIYTTAGIYTVSIFGMFPSMDFQFSNYPYSNNYANNKGKIQTVKQWGDNPWESMKSAFWGCWNLTIEATAGNPDLSKVTDMSYMFYLASAFNQDISGWDVSNVTNMTHMFAEANAFNQGLSGWNVSKVTDMAWMFYSADAFNQDLSEWDVSKVTDMGLMFYDADAFNQALSGWDVSNVTRMWMMFARATAFNQNLSEWDVSKVTSMGSMFYDATAFNQDLSGWDVSKVTNMGYMLSGVTLSTENYDALLRGWSVLPALQRDVAFGGGYNKYCNESARNILVNTYNWGITDGGKDLDENCLIDQEVFAFASTSLTKSPGDAAFTITPTGGSGTGGITYLSTDPGVATIAATTGEVTIAGGGTTTITATKAGDATYNPATASYTLTIDNAIDYSNAFVTTWEVSAGSLGITIPTNGDFAYSYTVDWGDDSSADTSIYTGDAAHTYTNAGIYTVSIAGTFPSIYFSEPPPAPYLSLSSTNSRKIKTIKQWGDNPWKSMNSAFAGCTNLTIEATAGTPDLSNVTDMSYMFSETTAFNQDISEWDVSKVMNMHAMFYRAYAFNQNLNGWEVGKVTNMRAMFAGTVAFNRDLSGWDVSKVTNMSYMFFGATAFNQDLSGWDVLKVTNMKDMFNGAVAFNQELSGWDVSKVTNMSYMFFGATAFNQDLSGWNVGNVTNMGNMFDGVTLSMANYDALLREWSALPALQRDVEFGGGDNKYCNESARNRLVNTYKWSITDGGKDLDENCLIDQAVFAFASTSLTKSTGDTAFTITPTGGSGTGGITYQSSDTSVATIAADTGEVTIAGVGTTTITATKAGDTIYNPATASYTLTIDNDNAIDYSNAFVTTWEVSAGSGITIPTNGSFAYSYTVDWGDSSADTRIYTGDAAHTYTTAGIYTVSIAGTFPSIYFNTRGSTNSRKIKTIKQWGDNPWKSMGSAFQGCTNITIEATAGNPDLSNVTDMSEMFSGATAFNRDLSGWDVSNVTNMSEMFSGATAFNRDLSGWDVSNVTNMHGMFGDATAFNQDLSRWNVGNVTYMSWMFFGATAFNQDISRWDVSNVTNMSSMFYRATAFNQNLSGWDVINVTDMSWMFYRATAFNQDLNRWNVSKVTDMSKMFYLASAFNQDLNRWNVSKVTDMSYMFVQAAAFNQDISRWDVSNVTNMFAMFSQAHAFNQDISRWDVSKVTDMRDMFFGVTLSTENYDALLREWSALPALQRDVEFGGGDNNYCNESARNRLVNTYNWGITDGGKDLDENCLIEQAVFAFASTSITKSTGDAAFTITPTGGSGTGGITYLSTDPGVASIAADSGEVTIAAGGTTTITATKAGDTTYNPATASYTLTIDIDYSNAFITTWEVAAGSLGITIPTNGDFDYSYTVDWGDSSADTRVYTGDAAHTYTTAGIYTVSIAGTFPGIYFDAISSADFTNSRKIKTIKQWGDNPWKSMNSAFQGCQNLIIEAAAGNPDLSSVTDMSWMFYGVTTFNQDISGWDVSKVTNMRSMFNSATAFNQDISGWDVSKVTNMRSMFNSAIAFNQDISRWDVSKVTNMWSTFNNAIAFNQDISRWDVSKVTDMSGMFAGAAFNRDISGWNVGKVTNMWAMFNEVTLSTANYDALLIGWSVLPSLKNDVPFGGGNSKYCNESARSILVNTYNWGITDGGKDTDENCLIDQEVFAFASTSLTKSTGDVAFTITPTGGSGTGGITYLSTDPGVASIAADSGEVTIAAGGTTTITATKAGDTTYNPATASYTLTIDIAIDYSNAFVTTWEVSAGSGITIPTNGDFAYSYTVDWGDDSSADTRIYTGDATHTYSRSGIYTVSIAGIFPSIYFSAATVFDFTNSRKILTIKQWGDNSWKSMNSAFYGCENLTIEATAGNPDLSNVTDMSSMFSLATAFNQDISEWDVSNVMDMHSMFYRAYAFNQNLNRWDVSNVTDMFGMFWSAVAFNQDLSEWDVSKVTDMGAMFFSATAFNQDINRWDVSNVTDMFGMFWSAVAFNQDLSEWDISKVTSMGDMFYGVTLSTENYDALLRGWSALPSLQTGVVFNGGHSNYCAESARNILVNTYNWDIRTDGGKDTDENCLIDQAVFAFASTSLTKSTGDTAFTITPTGGSGTGGITYQSSDTSVATIAADTGEVTIAAGGTTTITATKAGDTTYNPTTASYTLTIDLIDQEEFAFASTSLTKSTGDAAFTITPTGGSGTGGITYLSTDPGVASIAADSGEVTIAAGGTTTITATKAGDTTYNPTTASYTLTIDLINQEVFAFASTSLTKSTGDVAFTITPTGGSGTGGITYLSTDPGVASIAADSGEVTIAAGGTTTITATKAGDTTYNPATASYTLTIDIAIDYSNAFVTTWEVSAGSGITIPTNSDFAYSYTVDWGDDSSADTRIYTGDATHTYSRSGIYTVSISGIFPSIYFSAATVFDFTNSRKILTIKQWGDNSWKSMNSAFYGCENLTIEATAGNPDLSNVTDMSSMFSLATAFNQDISEWDVSNVMDMHSMFYRAYAFNQNLNRWDVSNVTDMFGMFWSAVAFNQDLSEWDVSKVTDMGAMFFSATAFNQDINRWDVSNVTDMFGMFWSAVAFNQDLSEWDISKVTSMGDMFYGVTLSTENYDALLRGWSALPSLQTGVVFNGGHSNYCAESARNILVNTYNWDIRTDGGKDTDENCLIDQAVFAFASTSLTKSTGDTAFTITPTGGSGTGGITYQSSDTSVATIAADTGEVTIAGVGTTTITATKAGDTTYHPATASYTLTIDNDNAIDYSNAFVTTWEVSAGSGITIPTNSDFAYSYTVDWGDDSSADTRIYTGDATHTYSRSGIYTVSIAGTFPSIYFNAPSLFDPDKRKIKTIKQWGDNPWKSMNSAFYGCRNLTIEATAGTPDLSNVTDMSWMFHGATAFNQSLIGWDVSNVTNMSSMFLSATAFNQDINGWDVSKVTNMSVMFAFTDAFNQDLNKWEVGKVTNMQSMFDSATAFNRDINGWDVSQVTDMSSMFYRATAFNQVLNEWEVGSVTSMYRMFRSAAAFNRDLSGWVVSSVTDMDDMFSGVTLSIANYDALLRGWSALPTLKSDVPFVGGNSKYCAVSARNRLVNTYNWGITDGGKDTDENCLIDQEVFAFASTSITKSTGDTTFTVTPTGGSGIGGITYLSTDPGVASIAADTGKVTIADGGTTTITATKAGDTNYNEATASYTLTVLGLTLTPSTLALNEGTTITYTAMLDTQPTGTVTVTITSDNTEVTPAPATLTFTTANWNSAQSVTITVAADTNLDDNIATLTHTASNGGYAGVTANLSVTATDIDTPPTFADGAAIDSQTYPVGTPITALILPEASGGVSTLTYMLKPNTSIPAGLTFDASTRTLSGTPTTSSLATTLAYTVTDSATPTPHTVTLAFTVTVVQVEVYNGGEVSYSSGAIATTDVGDENNDMRLMLPTDHTVTTVVVRVGTHTPTPGNPLPNGATYRGVGVDIELNSDLDEDTTATVCLSTAGVSEGQATIYHWTGNPAAWEEIGTDTSTQPGFVCGKTATFSPFAVGFTTPNDTTRLNEQILTRAASAMTASTLAAVAARVESATDGGSGKPLAFQLDGQSSLRGLLEKNGKAMLEEQMDYQRLLDGASFVLPLSATDNASAGNTGKTAVWGSSGFRDLAADDANGIDWDGKTFSAHLGMDKRLSEQTLAGLALSWNDASFEYKDGDDSGEYQYSIVNIHPYFGWSNAGLKLWGTAGYGQGEITIDEDGDKEELSTETTQLSLAGGFNHRLTGSPGRSLNIKGDVALTKVAVEAADKFDEQDVENSRVRLLLSGERRRELASGGALTPSLEIGVRSDGGSGGTTGTGVELGGGLRYANGGKVAVVGNVRTLLAGEYDELGADFSVQLSSQSGRGLSLTLHPTWGRTQSASDTLWNDGASEITGGDTALRGSVDTEVGYGMAATMLGSPGLLTPYTGITAQDGGTSRLRLGGRFAGSNGLRLDLEGAQKNTADDVSHTVLLRGEVSF